MNILKSKRPVLNTEPSIISGLFEIPITTTLDAEPSSISVNNWLRTVSPTPPSSPDLNLAKESSSSNIITHGDADLAFRKISLIAFSDSPTHFDKISEPLTRIILPLLSVASALANSVFPHPGGPYNSAPFGGLIPILVNFSGLIIAVIRFSSSIFLHSSRPPTSSQ